MCVCVFIFISILNFILHLKSLDIITTLFIEVINKKKKQKRNYIHNLLLKGQLNIVHFKLDLIIWTKK